jgi:hypothetical protein
MGRRPRELPRSLDWDVWRAAFRADGRSLGVVHTSGRWLVVSGQGSEKPVVSCPPISDHSRPLTTAVRLFLLFPQESFAAPQLLHRRGAVCGCVASLAPAQCYTFRARDVLKLCRCEFCDAGDSSEGESPEGTPVHVSGLAPGRCGLLRRPPPGAGPRRRTRSPAAQAAGERSVTGARRSAAPRFTSAFRGSTAVRIFRATTMRLGWLARAAFVF